MSSLGIDAIQCSYLRVGRRQLTGTAAPATACRYYCYIQSGGDSVSTPRMGI